MTNRTAVGALNGFPDILDTAQVKTSAQWHTLLNLGVTLVTHDSGGRLIGDAAESWTVSPDFLEYRFRLRQGIKDSQGHVLDSSDWRASFEYLLKSDGSTHSFISQFLTRDGIQTPDSSTLILKLKKPYKTLLQRLTTPEFILVPKAAFMGNSRPNFSVTSGPYFVEKISVNPHECRLRANPSFDRYSTEQPQTVVLVPMAKTNKEAFAKLAAGEWQFYLATLLPTDRDFPELLEQLNRKKVEMTPVEPSSLAFLVLLDSKRLTKPSQRIALAKFLGEKAEKEFSSPSSRPAHQIYPSGFIGAFPPNKESALFGEIKDQEVDTSVLPRKMIGYEANTSIITGVASWVTNALKSTGIEVETHLATAKDYIGHQHEIDHDYVILTTGLNSKDPAGSLLYLISPKDGLIPDANGKLNELLKTAVQSDTKKMTLALQTISENLIRSGRVVPLMHYGTMILSSPDVSAKPPSMFDDELRLADIRWK